MPSPFPGMDPFLERRGRWRGFHNAFLTIAQFQIAGLLPDGYEVDADADVYLHELPADPHRRTRVRVADESVTLTAGPGAGFGGVGGETAVRAAEPSVRTVLLPRVLEYHEIFLEVRDREGAEVVTVVELLSRANKHQHRDQYLVKRDELLHSDVNWW